jgi:hypothetical protein
MPLAYVVTLEKELPAQAAYTKAGSGKALARESERLDTAARTKKVNAITSMLSENPAALIAQLVEEGFDPTKIRVPAEAWFTAAEGLVTARGLIEHVTANLNNFKQPNPILRDLKSVVDLLSAAETAGVKFHFTKVNL